MAPRRWVVICAVCAVAAAGTFAIRLSERPAHTTDPATQRRTSYVLPTTPGSYIGLYPSGAPGSYAGATAFTEQTRVAPNLITYYSGWLEPFQTSFAKAVAAHGATPVVQIDPTNVSLAAISAGQYDNYLVTFAEAVRNFRHAVILSFGHEMNGAWYSWGYRHSSAAAFVAAWRHVVTLFRTLGARNVTWLWTVNVVHIGHNVPSPVPWWPGDSYVTWIGLDGYYYYTSSTFDSLFGPTIALVRALSSDPILIAETAVAPSVDQPTKITNLFASIRADGLLGFIWFDSYHVEDWSLSSPVAIAAFRREARAYRQPS
jgi:mannan endo-1,4-beta-mannosidase